jgi:hypothetical protein
MHPKAWTRDQPTLYRGIFVGTAEIGSQVKILIPSLLAIDPAEETERLLVMVMWQKAVRELAGGHIERGALRLSRFRPVRSKRPGDLARGCMRALSKR